MFINGYSDLKLKIPDCSSEKNFWAASFQLDSENIEELFPYINAVLKKAKYFENPHYIEFNHNGTRCALYEDRGIIAPFRDKESVLQFLNEFIPYLNNLYERRQSIKPDHSKYRHVSVLDIIKLLPGANCAVCGFPTCMAYAVSLSIGDAGIEKCLNSGKLSEEKTEKLTSMLGNLP